MNKRKKVKLVYSVAAVAAAFAVYKGATTPFPDNQVGFACAATILVLSLAWAFPAIGVPGPFFPWEDEPWEDED